ncbi:MAG: nucleotidyltransferase domain-containing protein [Saprospiraceae bacterium]
MRIFFEKKGFIRGAAGKGHIPLPLGQNLHTMLNKSSLTQAVKAELQTLYGTRLAKLILYGSYARGDQHEGSDIDFLVVLKDEAIKTGSELRYMNSALYDLELQFNTTISAHPTTLGRFNTSDYLFYQNVRREGIEV